MLKIEENVDISNFTTLKLNAKARYFTRVKNAKELTEAYIFAENNNIQTLVIGGGSNIIFTNALVDKLLIKIEISSFCILSDNKYEFVVRIGAGENWDYVVERTSMMGLSGIEAMSAIPGTVGGTPVQNVGAYGQEIKDTLISLDAYDKEEKIIKSFTNEECEFSYRDSIFKKPENKGRYVITSVTLRLLKNKNEIPQYADVIKYFADRNIPNPTPLEVRNAVIEIRSRKLPDPREIPSVGSFFKNPIISVDKANELKEKYSDMKIFPASAGFSKIPAGYLIESCGLKGKDIGKLSVYQNNALVITNPNGATYEDLLYTKNFIISEVEKKFGITLEPEPIFI